MGSKENVVEVGIKVEENTEELPGDTNYLKVEGSESNNDIQGEKNTHTHPFPHPRRESSIKTKSILKQGHLRVKEDGQKVYKKTPSQAIMAATQLGIGYSVGRLTARQERDILMVDFYFVEKVWFPGAGTKETPSHKHNDFRFKSYAPVAFRYFRDLFGIQPSDFLLSLASEPIREISNPGASGSLFFLSNDDMFIVKTVQHKEATFLQQLLPGYYMNIHQNPRTLLPKFFGLYCYQSGTSNIRLVVMNNLLPSRYKCHKKFDLKGSTYKRKASKSERDKKSPTWKDLDFLEQFPKGIMLDAETYDAVIKTISRDVRVLESFNIMDYSFLLGIHNIDLAEAEREKAAYRANSMSQEGLAKSNPDREARTNEFGAALEAIPLTDDDEDEVRPHGGVPAKNEKGERLILFMGIIDILQSYRMAKKMEHSWKALLTDGDTVSVHKPSFYSTRFLNFIKDKVFYRAVQRVNTKRRSVRASEFLSEKADILLNKTENESPEIPERIPRVVKIVEPEPSLNGSIDYLSTGVESNASSEDLLDRESTSDDLSSVNTFQINRNDETQTNIEATSDSDSHENVSLTITQKGDVSEISGDVSEVYVTQVSNLDVDTDVNSEVDHNIQSETSNVQISNHVSESYEGEPTDLIDSPNCDDAIELSDIKITTKDEHGQVKQVYSVRVESTNGDVQTNGNIEIEKDDFKERSNSPLVEDSHL